MAEAEIQSRIMLAVGALPDVRVFRNTVGQGWTGHAARWEGSTVLLTNARAVTFGLHIGSPDLIGWRSEVVTPDMVGQRIARIVGLEVKASAGRASEDQERFLAAMLRAGALAAIVRSPAQALELVAKPVA